MDTDVFLWSLDSRIDRLKLTHREAARYLGVSPDTVSAWLAGRRKPDAAALRLLVILDTVERRLPELHAAMLRQCRVTRVKPGPAKGSVYMRRLKRLKPRGLPW